MAIAHTAELRSDRAQLSRANVAEHAVVRDHALKFGRTFVAPMLRTPGRDVPASLSVAICCRFGSQLANTKSDGVHRLNWLQIPPACSRLTAIHFPAIARIDVSS